MGERERVDGDGATSYRLWNPQDGCNGYGIVDLLLDR